MACRIERGTETRMVAGSLAGAAELGALERVWFR